METQNRSVVHIPLLCVSQSGSNRIGNCLWLGDVWRNYAFWVRRWALPFFFVFFPILSWSPINFCVLAKITEVKAGYYFPIDGNIVKSFKASIERQKSQLPTIFFSCATHERQTKRQSANRCVQQAQTLIWHRQRAITAHVTATSIAPRKELT